MFRKKKRVYLENGVTVIAYAALTDARASTVAIRNECTRTIDCRRRSRVVVRRRVNGLAVSVRSCLSHVGCGSGVEIRNLHIKI